MSVVARPSTASFLHAVAMQSRGGVEKREQIVQLHGHLIFIYHTSAQIPKEMAQTLSDLLTVLCHDSDQAGRKILLSDYLWARASL